MALNEAVNLLQQLKSGPGSTASLILTKLKIILTQLPGLVPPYRLDDQSVREQLLIAREVYELAAEFEVINGNVKDFERYVNQLKVYYRDLSGVLPESPKKWEVLGLYLLALLSANRVGDFHVELELIPIEMQSNRFINYSIQLEQELMEGSYNQLWNASAHVPSQVYMRFVSNLVDTVRERILECCEKSYDKLSVIDVTQLLNLNSSDVAVQLAESKGWERRGDYLYFKKEPTDHLEIPAHAVISQVLSYASELERIV